MENGKQRRPIGMRDDVPSYDPREDNMGAMAFFEYREDAVAAAREWVEPEGYRVHIQYFGRYDLWAIEAWRKSWRDKRIWVEACLHPERPVTQHAHVPLRHSYARLIEGRATAG
jgi:hypothetical protein